MNKKKSCNKYTCTNFTFERQCNYNIPQTWSLSNKIVAIFQKSQLSMILSAIDFYEMPLHDESRFDRRKNSTQLPHFFTLRSIT